MSQQAIAALLKQHIGLNADSLGKTGLTKVVTQEMGKLGFVDAATYFQSLQTSPGALEALVEAVVVPETSFFRNPESFAYLKHYVSKRYVSKRYVSKRYVSATDKFKMPHPRVCRLLSLPCSTGEEPYSMAIALLEAGLPAGTFQVDAMDISTQALNKARQGYFSHYSFRKTPTYSPEHHRQQYFQAHQGQYLIDRRVRSQVNFHQGNILAPLGLHGTPSYDIIFCRNLLIYLHPAARRSALSNLNRLLVPGGLLFVGYAETSQINSQQFTSVAAPQAFAYRKLPEPIKTEAKTLSTLPVSNSAVSNSPVSNRAAFTSARSPLSHCASSDQKPALPTAAHPSQSTVGHITPAPTDLAKIRALADGGQLKVALEQCDRYLKAYPTSADAYLLSGEIHQAQNHPEKADRAFQKSLYLNPNCIESLTHRLQLCEHKGDSVTAKRMRLRLQRLVNSP